MDVGQVLERLLESHQQLVDEKQDQPGFNAAAELQLTKGLVEVLCQQVLRHAIGQQEKMNRLQAKLVETERQLQDSQKECKGITELYAKSMENLQLHRELLEDCESENCRLNVAAHAQSDKDSEKSEGSLLVAPARSQNPLRASPLRVGRFGCASPAMSPMPNFREPRTGGYSASYPSLAKAQRQMSVMDRVPPLPATPISHFRLLSSSLPGNSLPGPAVPTAVVLAA